jgi:TolB-like protein/tetratricopeptide (TPR) repeat protein/DNA-binding winged helix-turn-helix (wHTH) protein
MGQNQAADIIRFGPFELSVEAQELRKHGTPLNLSGQPIQVLILLTANPGKLITREELRRKLWHGNSFGDFDHGLNAAVNRLREKLGDSATAPRYIETLQGRGYRFIAEVQSPSDRSTPGTLGERPRVEQAVVPHTGPRRRTWMLISSALAVILLIGAVLGLKFRRGQQSARIDSIAVLPFANADANTEYLSDGITTGLIHTLSRVPQLRVMSRATVFHYKGRQADPQKVGDDLNVGAVVTGTVAQRGDNLHIDTALVDVRDGSELWGEGYDRKLSEIGNLQQDITRDISTRLQLRFSSQVDSAQEKVSPQDSETYLLYLHARYFLEKQTTNDVRTAIDYFQRAISRNPNFGRAHAGLADAYLSLGLPWMGGLPPKQALQEAKTAAENAIRVSSDFSEAHVSLAHVVLLHDWDWRRAEEEYQRAIQLDPNSAQAHNLYSELLQAQGRTEEAVREAEKAAQLDPVNLPQLVGYPYYTARQYDQAEKIFRRYSDHEGLAWVYTATKRYSQAITELQAEKRGSLPTEEDLASLGQVYALQGKKQEAEKLLAELMQRSKKTYVSPYLIAFIFAGLGDREHALAALEQAYQEHDQYMIYVKVDPKFDQLHSEPRFQTLLRAIGLSN